jgi:hypothetical protein
LHTESWDIQNTNSLLATANVVDSCARLNFARVESQVDHRASPLVVSHFECIGIQILQWLRSNGNAKYGGGRGRMREGKVIGRRKRSEGG